MMTLFLVAFGLVENVLGSNLNSFSNEDLQQPDQGSDCRCLPGNPCWALVPWDELNISVHGQLERSEDMMTPCLQDMKSTDCSEALNKSQNDGHWVGDHAYNTMHTSYFGAWNVSTDHSVYTVRALNEDHFGATVAFAHEHNLRLVIKGTGHDWYGRSAAAGSLLLWTHLRKNMTWHDSFSACPDTKGAPAVTIQSGVQFYDLYPAAMRRGRLVVGGTCDTVGVGGCWLSGCYGPFSRTYGNGAMNILSARVVIANGTIVTASKCSHPDLFWSLRGGGGGVAAVVVDFVARTHPAPTKWSSLSLTATAKTGSEYRDLLEEGLRVWAVTSDDSNSASDGGFGFGIQSTDAIWDPADNFTMTIGISGYFTELRNQTELFKPLVDYINMRGGSLRYHLSNTSWNISSYNPNAPFRGFPWGGAPSATDISASIITMYSKYIPSHFIKTQKGRAVIAEAFVNVTRDLPLGVTVGIMTPKGQAGISAENRAEFDQTSLNPVILDAAGTLLIMDFVPWVEELPPSSKLLKVLWEKGLKHKTELSTTLTDPLRVICQQGAEMANESAAVHCLDDWRHHLLPMLKEKEDKARATLNAALPNIDSNGNEFSGSYWSETDYFVEEFQLSYWGKKNYKKLLEVKDRYDPHGLFVCHNCVGSERWTVKSSYNCRRNKKEILNSHTAL